VTVEKHQELIRLIEDIADRIQLCENQVDQILFAKALGHLVDLQHRQSKELL